MNQTNQNASTELANREKGEVVYNVAGQEVKLNYKIVRDFLVRGGGNVSDNDIVQFISICKFNQLNPFLGESYLVKYKDAPAQMIVSKEALLKRADTCEHFVGMEAGIIVKRNGEYIDLDGCFYGDGDVLVGGWARVHRDDRKFPYVARIRFDEYDKKQALWKEKPSTMISKVAKVQALREAFPAQLGAMYTEEETKIVTPEYTEIRENVEAEKRDNANGKAVAMPPAGDAAPQEQEQPANNAPQPGF